jgi:FkbM family methyltransferase
VSNSVPFISYAQNYEDVMLLRALKDVERGFYIDAGANDPIGDSVTYSFYDRGWRGINIEPLPRHFEDLQRERPRDINLNCAAGAEAGEIEVLDFGVIGWASADTAMINQRRQETGQSGTAHRVPVMTLRDICQQHVSGDIHFLKIDVEGFEHAVLQGMDFDTYRPWIVLVEAVWGQVAEWEKLILDHAYTFIYEDGVNRFYLANERPDLRGAFRLPPNVEDGFIRLAHYRAERRAEQAEKRAERAEERVADLERALVAATERGVVAELPGPQAASGNPGFYRRARGALGRLMGRSGAA